MDYSSLTQSVGRPGETVYMTQTPSYSPIQPVPAIPSGQAGFFRNGGNPYKDTETHARSTRPNYTAEEMRKRAEQIQSEAKSQKLAIVPGMVVDFFA